MGEIMWWFGWYSVVSVAKYCVVSVALGGIGIALLLISASLTWFSLNIYCRKYLSFFVMIIIIIFFNAMLQIMLDIFTTAYIFLYIFCSFFISKPLLDKMLFCFFASYCLCFISSNP